MYEVYNKDGIIILRGDSSDYVKSLDDKQFDLLLTDPPYGINIANKPFRGKFKPKEWDKSTPSVEHILNCIRVTKDQVIWGGNYFTLPASRGFLIWDKKQSPKFSSAMCEFAWTSRNAPAKMFARHAASFEKFHPTTKPLDLLEWCVSFFPKTTSILDPYMGSGSSLVVAKKLGLAAVGVELDEEYIEVAIKRLENF